MYPFLESIRLEKQKLFFLSGHEARFRQTQRDNWGRVIYTGLQNLLTSDPAFPKDDDKYKCRVVYSPEQLVVNFIRYQPRDLQRLVVVADDHIDYWYKSTDRRSLERHTENVGPHTEVLIFKNGLLTDSSFSNLALWDGNTWWTPKTPLLKGVHRRELISRGIIQEKDIPLTSLSTYQKIKLVNVMMDWENTWSLDASAIQHW